MEMGYKDRWDTIPGLPHVYVGHRHPPIPIYCSGHCCGHLLYTSVSLVYLLHLLLFAPLSILSESTFNYREDRSWWINTILFFQADNSSYTWHSPSEDPQWMEPSCLQCRSAHQWPLGLPFPSLTFHSSQSPCLFLWITSPSIFPECNPRLCFLRDPKLRQFVNKWS